VLVLRIRIEALLRAGECRAGLQQCGGGRLSLYGLFLRGLCLGVIVACQLLAVIEARVATESGDEFRDVSRSEVRIHDRQDARHATLQRADRGGIATGCSQPLHAPVEQLIPIPR
jgi:hypothetical protein